MIKVVFSVTKAGKNSNRVSGVGYITDEDLLIPMISKNGKACKLLRLYFGAIKAVAKIKMGSKRTGLRYN